MKYLLILLLFCGCGYDRNCRIESDTSWSCDIDTRHYEGLGNNNIALDKDDCVEIRKETQQGYIEITITESNTWFGSEEKGKAKTSLPFGEVRVCD